MKLYKLTDVNGCTMSNTNWAVGKVVKIDPKIKGTTLCTDQVLHAYTSLLLAELMNPIHGNYNSTKRWWEVEGTVVVNDGTKVGAKELTVVRELFGSEIPTFTTTQRVAFAILCASKVYKDPKFIAWAKKWLSNKDRSSSAARAAKAAAWAAKAAARDAWAAWAAAKAAAWAAKAAARDAWAAEDAARDAWAAAEAARAAKAAAEAAKAAAKAAARDTGPTTKKHPLDLTKLAKKALSYK